MLSTNPSETPPPARTRTSPPPALPRLCSKKRARAEWGDCGETRFYEIAREHDVELHKIGSKTVVSGEDVHRVAEAIIAASRKATIDAKALATKSVAARLKRRDCAPDLTQQTAPVRRRRRRGSTAA